MKIWGQVPNVSEIYGKNNKVSKVNNVERTASKRDVVSISTSGKDFKAVLDAIKQSPDIREDKVAEISRKLEKDEYKVSSNDIADRILNGMFEKRV